VDGSMKRILIIQLCRLGDILQTTPMLRGLRREHPDAEITLVLHDLMANAPVPAALYDRTLAFPYSRIGGGVSDAPQDWNAHADHVRQFLRELGTEPFDLILNLSHNDISGMLCGLIPAREVRGGYIGADRRRVVRGVWMTYFWSSQLWRDQGCFNLVDLHNWMAGVASDAAPLNVDITDGAHASVDAWLSTHAIGDRPLIAVQLGASEERKRWPAERFAQAVNLIPEALGEIVFVGATHERQLFQQAEPHLRRRVHVAIGETSLLELAALLSRCQLLLTNDTGTMHVATAAGARVVDVSVGPVFVHETGPYGEGHFVIEPAIECYPCTLGSDCHHMSCHGYPAPADVAALAVHALGAGPLPSPARARIMTGAFGAGGHIEYRTIWPAVESPAELRRQAARRVWEYTLQAPGVPTDVVPPSVARVGVSTSGDQTALRALALVARDAAGLAASIPERDPSEHTALLAQVATKLRLLQFAGQTEVACQPIVAYLTLRLGGIAETAVEDVARIYANECAAAAERAELLAARLAGLYDAVASEERLAS
jgi:ADP-heptose:LPS heptosyltransferase